VDESARGQTDPARAGCTIPPRPRQPHSQRAGLDALEAIGAGQTAEAGRDRTLVAGRLAGAQKKACEEGRIIVFIGESGFYLLPMVVRSYAPRSLTPILKEYLSRDHLATIAGITLQGKLFLKAYEHPISSEEVIEFLNYLQRQIPGLLLVIWDGSPTHRSKRIKAYLSDGAAHRLHLERFPGIAPELNPTEWV
jgi:hypothetical protein